MDLDLEFAQAGFRIRKSWLFEPVGAGYAPLAPVIRSNVCAPYVRELRWAMNEVDHIVPGLSSSNYSRAPSRLLLRKVLQRRLIFALGPLIV